MPYGPFHLRLEVRYLRTLLVEETSLGFIDKLPLSNQSSERYVIVCLLKVPHMLVRHIYIRKLSQCTSQNLLQTIFWRLQVLLC